MFTGLRDLEVIVKYATMMGVKCDISIAPSLVFHHDYFKGMVCQLVRKKTRGGQVQACSFRQLWFPVLKRSNRIRFNVFKSSVRYKFPVRIKKKFPVRNTQMVVK